MYAVLTPTGRAALEGAAPGHVAAVRRFVFERARPRATSPSSSGSRR